jgi:hypothetical protein
MIGPPPNPPTGQDWIIQALPGKAFMVALRLYGSETAVFDQTWRPDDFV